MDNQQRFVAFFSQLTPKSVVDIRSIYAPNAHFKDPFNDVSGHMPIMRIFQDMFESTENPHFVIKQTAQEANCLFLEWDFHFKRKHRAWTIAGCTRVHFNADNQVQEHIDYWDPAEQIYSKVPVLSVLMRYLQNRLRAD